MRKFKEIANMQTSIVVHQSMYGNVSLDQVWINMQVHALAPALPQALIPYVCFAIDVTQDCEEETEV